MMSDTFIQENLTRIFRQIFDNNTIILTPEMTAEDIEAWDSMANIALAIEIENVFRLKIKIGDMENLKSIDDIIKLIKSNKAFSVI
jgi:acyl carrier protein